MCPCRVITVECGLSRVLFIAGGQLHISWQHNKANRLTRVFWGAHLRSVSLQQVWAACCCSCSTRGVGASSAQCAGGHDAGTLSIKCDRLPLLMGPAARHGRSVGAVSALCGALAAHPRVFGPSAVLTLAITSYSLFTVRCMLSCAFALDMLCMRHVPGGS